MTAGAMMAVMPPDETDLPVIELARPMLGFPEKQRFALVRLDEAGDLCRLTSVEEPELSFLVVPPGRFFPDYAPAVDDDVLDELEIRSAEDVLLLVVLNPGTSLASTTANLAAPVLVNPAKRRGGQIVLDDTDLPLAAPLVS
ncbi:MULTISPECIES: flagellar assembly protein FliW [unclassified Nocardioides]|uniref:flagellar assembly protein FliW n=1 Tax=unclassified Nocardioides TaxID=2615069 RepID=UPI000305FC85|nr:MULTISPECIES: flagellar assembly protein FliW [unclassified Nocardioides]